MINKLTFFFILIITILPFTLISGPAIPDLSITFSLLFFIIIILHKKNYKLFFKNKIFIISFLFWLYLLIISISAENIYLSFRDALIFIRILLIPLLIIYLSKIKLKNLENILLFILIAVIFVTLDTFYQFIQYESDLGFGKDLFGFVPNWYGRLTGPFGDELIPGAYLSKFSFLGLIIIFIKIKKNFQLNIISIIYLTSVGIVIFASGERMALATFLMGLGFLFIFYNKKRLIFSCSLILIIISCLIIKKIHPFYNDFKIIESTPFHLGLKIEKTFPCKNDLNLNCKKIIKLQPEFKKVIKNFNVSAYGEIYNLGIKMFKDHKLFGIGLNNFTHLCKNDERYNNIIENYGCATHPHNIYLQWLVETGFFGLLFFISYLFYIFFYILKKKSKFSMISIATLLILFWPIMSTGSLLKNWNGISIFFIVGICLALTRLKKKTN